MSLPVSFLESVTDEHRMKGLVDNIWDDSFFGKRMMERNTIKYQDGDVFSLAIEYSKAKKGGAYNKYDSKIFSIREFASRVKYARKFYSEDIILYDRDVDPNKGQAQLVDLISTTVRSAFDGVKDSVWGDLFRLDATDADSEGKKVNSLEDLYNQTAATEYGALSASQFSGWVANVNSATDLAALTQYLYKKNLREVYKGRGRQEKPTIGFTTQSIWDKIEDLEIDKERGAYQKELNIGKTSILIDGIPLVVDTFQNAGYMDFINEDFFMMFIHTSDNFTRTPWERSPIKHAMTSGITLTTQFGCTRRDVHTRMSALI